MGESDFFIAEPDVAISDFLLSIECLILLWCLRARADQKGGNNQRWFMLYFAVAALAALTGGLAHGFFPETDSAAHFWLWAITLSFVAANGLACWNVGAAILWKSDSARRKMLWVSSLFFVAFCCYAFTGLREFTAAMAAYLPPVFFLLFAFVRLYMTERSLGAAYGIASIVLTLLGGLVIVFKVSLHPLYMTSSTVFHVIQGVSAFLIFKAFRSIP